MEFPLKTLLDFKSARTVSQRGGGVIPTKIDHVIPFATGALIESCKKNKSTKEFKPKNSGTFRTVQSAKEAIRDLLAGCEHHRKLALLNEILHGIRREERYHIPAVQQQTNSFVSRAVDEHWGNDDNMAVPTKRQKLSNGAQPRGSLKLTFVVSHHSR